MTECLGGAAGASASREIPYRRFGTRSYWSDIPTSDVGEFAKVGAINARPATAAVSRRDSLQLTFGAHALEVADLTAQRATGASHDKIHYRIRNQE
jgi:hypothetical protein